MQILLQNGLKIRKKISRGCAPDPLTPGQVRGVPEGCCRGHVWIHVFPAEYSAVAPQNYETEGLIRRPTKTEDDWPDGAQEEGRGWREQGEEGRCRFRWTY